MKRMIALVLALAATASPAQDLSAVAKLDPAVSMIVDDGDGVDITLGLSQSVPWRVRLMDDPPRLVMDFREVDWAGAASIWRDSSLIAGLRAGGFRPGWSRLVMELAAPLTVTSAEMASDGETSDGGATLLTLRLDPADPADFAARAALPEPPEWALPVAVAQPAGPAPRTGPPLIVLDPGHGGIDPGAERDGRSEADLVLTFARELKELLLRDGTFAVQLTREEDVFVPLETRISVARAAGASVFLSLHADAISEGEAVGATIYKLDDKASDAAARALAERHDRDDLLSGVDLTEQDDLVATVLIDMARAETTPRNDRLAAALARAITDQGLRMHRHPVQGASFSVLKSPDIPSVLLELGFLSSASDLGRLTDADWRAQMQAAVLAGLKAWMTEDQGLSGMRQK